MADLNQTSWSETDSSNNSASPNGWTSTTMLPSGVEPTARAMMGALTRGHNQISPPLTSGGSANAHTLAHTVAHTAYVAGDLFCFTAGFTNTGSATLNVDTLGAKTFKIGSTNLAGGELQATMPVLCGYDGTNVQLIATGGRLAAPATFTAAPSDPATTTSTSAVMMGLGSTCTITPKRSGSIRFYLDVGAVVGTASGGWIAGMRYGTGTAPANGVASGGGTTGSAIGVNKALIIPDTQVHPATFAAIVTGLTLGTAYWFDLAVGTSFGSATAGIQQVYAEAVEI